MGSPERRGVRLIQIAFVSAASILLIVPLLSWRGAAGRRWPETPRSAGEWHDWPAAVETALVERIGLRPVAVRAYSAFLYFVLHASSTKTVVLGDAGWLYFDSREEPFEGGTDTIADARRSRPFGTEKLGGVVEAVLSRQQLLASWHGRYLLVVVPNKSSVYPEFLPASMTQVGRGKPLEQLASELAPPPEGPLLDLTEVMLAGKRQEPLYYRTDSHWNPLGALRGFRAVMAALQADYPGLLLPRPDDFVARQQPAPGGDLARMLSLAPSLPEPRWSLSLRSDPKLPDFQRQLKVLVYRDSFFDALPEAWHAYLPGLIVQERYAPWSDSEVRALRPAIVIQMIAERRLRFKGRRIDGLL